MAQKQGREEGLVSALNALDELRLQLDEALARADEEDVRRLAEEIQELAQVIDEQFDVRAASKAPRNEN